MNNKLLLFVGPNIDYTLPELSEFEKVSNSENNITLSELEDLPPSSACVIYAHGNRISPPDCTDKTSEIAIINLIDNELRTDENILILQNKLGIKHFYLFSCLAGILPYSLDKNKDKLKKGTTITIFASSKYETTNSFISHNIQKINAFYSTHKRTKIKKIDREFFLEHGLFAPWTIVRCEVTEQAGKKKLLAFKVRAPKTTKDIKNYTEYLRGHQLSLLIPGNKKSFQNWKNRAEQASEFPNLDTYPIHAMEDAIFRKNYKRIKTWTKIVDINLYTPSLVNPYIMTSRIGNDYQLAQLFNKKALTNYQTPDGQTVFFIACQNGHEAIVKLLLDNGIDVNLQRLDKETAIFNACYNGHEAIVKLLLEHAANPNFQNVYGETALYLACQNGHENIVKLLLDNGANVDFQTTQEGLTALNIAAEKGYIKIVKMLLDKAANINHQSRDKELTPLYHACENSHKEIVKLLIDNGAKIDLQRKTGGTALFAACQLGDTEIVKMLLDRGASVNLLSIGRCRTTALHVACQFDHEEIVQILLNKNADINLQNSYGKIAFSVADQMGHTRIIQLFLDRFETC